MRQLAYNSDMAKLEEAIISSAKENRQFVGTIAPKSEDLTLPNGATMALGIDDGRWVFVYQKTKGAQFLAYEYDSNTNSFRVDKRAGTDHDFSEMRRLLKYFFAHAQTEDLVTILPKRPADE